MSLVAQVQRAIQTHKDATESDANDEAKEQEFGELKPADTSRSLNLRQPDTPSARTGPPRSLSFAYPLAHTPIQTSTSYLAHDTELLPPHGAAYYGDNDQEFLFSPNVSQSSTDASGFRTPLEPHPTERFWKDKGKKREARTGTSSTEKSNESDSWNPLNRWFHDQPADSPGQTRGNSGEYFPDTTQHDATTPTMRPPTSIITRLFTQEPAKSTEDELDAATEIAIRSPTIDEERQGTREETPGTPSILPKASLNNRKGEEKPQRGASYPHPQPGSPALATSSPPGSTPNTPAIRIRRAFSVPHQIFGSSSQQSGGGGGTSAGGSEEGRETEPKNEVGKAKWSRLRSLLPHIAQSGPQSPLAPRGGPESAVGPSVNIIDELITGGLATLMPKLWFERGERGQRRIPILLHRLRLRITDSLHPLHKTRSVFRIECEYANGAARWVVYRELRDFVSLHGHYTVSQAVHGAGANLRLQNTDRKDKDGHMGLHLHSHGREKLPEFPATSIPYFKFLNREGGSKIGKAEFARLQRERLENYLINLIRVVMFHPTSNRLAAFLEISALSIALAQSGGAQYKAGYLRIEAVSQSGGFISSLFSTRGEDKEGRGSTPFGRKSASYSQRREQRWCAVRESYLVTLVEPGELEVWDVFLLDSEFKIERPKRYYRQGLGGILHLDSSEDEHDDQETVHSKSKAPLSSAHPHFQPGEKDGSGIHIKVPDDSDAKSVVSSMKSKVSRIFHRDGHSARSSKVKVANGSGSGHSLKKASSSRSKKSLIGLGIEGEKGERGRKKRSKEGSLVRKEKEKTALQEGSNGNELSVDEATDRQHSRKSSFDSDVSTSLTRRSGSMIGSDDGSEDGGLHLKGKLRSRSDSDSTLSGARTPMLDPSINMNGMLMGHKVVGAAAVGDDKFELKNPGDVADGNDRDEDRKKAVARAMDRQQQAKKAEEKEVSKHTFYIVNSQMRLKLYARNERQMLQFITGLERVAQNSPYTGKNRFDSYAPIRLNVAAQWLVDGRDYFWNMSRAILMAKESIYLHDWWLSPELLMRRPGKEHYRLDKLLERKAHEGVKIYIILYLEVSNRTTPTDSNYAKQRLSSLHPNVMVQRSPSHFQTGTFYWAHHEKLCVIDQTIAFMGGLDGCFGRWDTPQHALTDDTLDTDQPEIWPGKDYSNPRVSDFHNLNKPEEDMYDRTKVPRMPWHDVAMQIVGQPARDLARHFVQRWNYLLRIKNHSRIMPFLLPPPEFRPGPWSMGTPGKIEQSVQNAYLKAIQMSEHFVYIENQFFITSTVVEDVKIENKIGDALVQRIIRAHKDKTPWKCCILIPLLPGFTFPVDHSDASAIRIILECQNRTICRGPDSIFSRLRREGIDPDEYISFFSLRNWAKMRDDVLVTEQVYIHAKICIVDDRLVIIGSANINERSQRGDRDSELAAVIRDTDLIDCTMAGKPFKVGRFAHTLRMRLMREHLGIDVDALVEEDLMSHEPTQPEYEQEAWDPSGEQKIGREEGFTEVKSSRAVGNSGSVASNMANFVGMAAKSAISGGAAAIAKGAHVPCKNEGAFSPTEETIDAERRDFNAKGEQERGFASSAIPTLEENMLMEERPHKENVARESRSELSQPHSAASSSSRFGSQHAASDGTVYGAPAGNPLDDAPPRPSGDLDNDQQRTAHEARSTLRKHLSIKSSRNYTVPTARPDIHPDDFEDPIHDSFWKEKWIASAAHNTEIYRKVFHAIPDDLVTTWKMYREFVAQHNRPARPIPRNDGGRGDPHTNSVPVSEEDGVNGTADGSALGHEFHDGTSTQLSSSKESQEGGGGPSVDGHASAFDSARTSSGRKPTKGTEAFDRWEREQMERLLNTLNGHLVIYPTRFLEGEDSSNNFLFNADRLLPLPIYA